MTKCTYEYIRQLNGEPRLEIVTLSSKGERDFDEVLHRVGLEFCMSPQGRKLCKNISGLSLEQLLDIITPEMLVPDGVTMERLRGCAVQKDNVPPVVSWCEIKLCREICDRYNQQLRDMKKYAELIAGHLEAYRLSGHPAISAWAPEIIPSKSISWAYQYVTEKDEMRCSLATFLERKIQEAKPHGGTEGAA